MATGWARTTPKSAMRWRMLTMMGKVEEGEQDQVNHSVSNMSLITTDSLKQVC